MKATWLIGAVMLAVAGPVGYNLHKDSQEKARLIQAQITKEEALQRMQADVADMLWRVEAYHKRLPTEPNPSWLVTEAIAIGERSGLQLSSISQESPQEVSQFIRLAVSFEFTASYHQLGAFLDRLEHSERFVRVEHLEVTPTKEEGGDATIRLTLSTLYVPPLMQGAEPRLGG